MLSVIAREVGTALLPARKPTAKLHTTTEGPYTTTQLEYEVCPVIEFKFSGVTWQDWEELESRANRMTGEQRGLTPVYGMTTYSNEWGELGKWSPIITQVYYP